MKRALCILSCMNAGGAETFLMKIYRSLDKTKYQLDFCINQPDKQLYEDEILSYGGEIYRIPTKSENIKEYKKALTNVVRENNYEYVLRITSNAAGFLDLKVAKQAGAKYCSARSSNSSNGRSLKSKIAHCLGSLLYDQYVDARIAPSDLAAKYTFGEKAYKEDEVKILHNGIDLDVFNYNEELRKQIREEFAIPENAKLIGHVGRFEQQKNHIFLIDIFAEIKKKESNAFLMLVGEGTLERQIDEKVKRLNLQDSVIFTGIRKDIQALLSAMDVFVFPSFYEGMPNTVVEAQATGLPCIIADTITKEADITGLVDYLPLEATASDWAECALNIIGNNRESKKEVFVRKEYDIQSVTQKFTQIIFDE